MIDQKRFRISVGDDPDHEDLTAEIYFDEIFVALISQEEGLENAILELQPCPSGGSWSFSLSDFMEILANAKIRLHDLRRT